MSRLYNANAEGPVRIAGRADFEADDGLDEDENEDAIEDEDFPGVLLLLLLDLNEELELDSFADDEEEDPPCFLVLCPEPTFFIDFKPSGLISLPFLSNFWAPFADFCFSFFCVLPPLNIDGRFCIPSLSILLALEPSLLELEFNLLELVFNLLLLLLSDTAASPLPPPLLLFGVKRPAGFGGDLLLLLLLLVKLLSLSCFCLPCDDGLLSPEPGVARFTPCEDGEV